MFHCLLVAVSGKEEIVSQMPVENAGLDNVMHLFISSLFRICIMLMAFVILQEDIVCGIFYTYVKTLYLAVLVFHLAGFAAFSKLF